jgi:uncharacterized protein YmfQ (DUF2313 family)
VQNFSADDYKEMQKRLLPPGKAWTRDDESNLIKLLKSRAVGYEKIDIRGLEAIEEAIPSTTVELLEDWERVCGLPDPCLQGAEQSTEERRAAVLSKLTSIGSLSKAFLLTVAESIGFEGITIDEFWDFQVGRSTVGKALTNGDDWRFAFQVNGSGAYKTTFKVGISTVGEKLADYGNTRLQCAMSRHKPAHTIAIYDVAEEGGTR